MVSLIYFVLASLVSGEAATTYFDCGDNKFKNEAACVATKWCVWNVATPASPVCINDPCLKYIASVEDDDGACKAQENCNLYYITDIHDCESADGEVVNQTDIFCRSNNNVYHKQPLDACFYQDLKSRYTNSNTTQCSNLPGGIACAAVGSGATFYCDSTGEQTCNKYLDDNDLPGFCNCLGKDYCNLYPGCAISKASGGPCVNDPCASAIVQGSNCVGNIAGITTCVVANVQAVSGTGLVNKAYCVSNDDSTVVKKNDYNPCYYAINQTVTYPSWDDTQSSNCFDVNEQNQCTSIQSVTCESVDIAAGYFSSAQGHYCTDNKNRKIPSPSAALGLRLPSIFFLLAIVGTVLM